ncbi:MAG TPA: hypothetical protein VE620_04325 [Myxococcales bacterium]|nr:hypothetical protein [Myxococcales bacterium]
MKPKIVANVLVGNPKAKPTTPGHVPWVREGNKKGSTKRSKGLHVKGDMVTATASRSTGVNALARNSIVPGAPRLTPM